MKLLFKLLFLIMSLTLLYKRLPIKIDEHGISLSLDKMDKIMAISKVDATNLNQITTQLEINCVNNKQGLTEQACIENIRNKNQLCMQDIMKQFSNNPNNTDNLQNAANHFADCLSDTQ